MWWSRRHNGKDTPDGAIATHAPWHLGDPGVPADQPAAHLLHLADPVQPARHRSLGPQLLLRQLVRQLRWDAPARLRAAVAAVPRVALDGGDHQRAPPPPGGRGVHARQGAARTGCLRHVRRRERGPGAPDRSARHPPEGVAAAIHRLEDQHRPARERGGRAVRPERPEGRRLMERASPHRRPREAGRRPRHPVALRRLGSDDLLHLERGRLGDVRQGDRRGARGQGDAPDPQSCVRGRGVYHPSRDDRGTGDDGPDRVQVADAVQGRLVRQRPVAEGARRRTSNSSRGR